MRIDNFQVYGLAESMYRSGYPMQTKVKEFIERPMDDELYNPQYESLNDNPHFKRAVNLANTPIGSAHDNFLCGIIVQFDLEAPSYFWPELQRYHFTEIISSQSKMHRITKFDLSEQCIEGTDQRIIAITQEYIDKYNQNPTLENYENILKNTPMGLELTAGITTNYRQLKTMYHQRKNHRLSCWKQVFCPWVESLPYAKELILGD